jgi:hypothetical protein
MKHKETYVPSLSAQWEAHKTPERIYRACRVESEVATLHDERHLPYGEGMASSLTWHVISAHLMR